MAVSKASMPAEHKDFAHQPLVFTHIPKTAGTTVNFALKMAFRERGAFHLHEKSTQELAALTADPALHVYSGHLPYMQMAAAFAATGRRPLFMTVLRDPIDRILSAYSYAREKPGRRWHDLAISHDINAFVAAMKKKHPRFLAGKLCRYLCPDGGIKAKAALKSLKDNFALVGLQSDLEDFLLAVEDLAGCPMRRPKRRNQSTHRVISAELEAKTRDILDKMTEEDRRLYDMTLEWLAK